MPPIFLDSEAQRLYDMGEALGGESGAFLIKMATRIEKQADQLSVLRSITGDYSKGVLDGEARVYGRANIQPKEPPQTLTELLKTKEFKEAMSKLPVKKVPRGVSGIDPISGKPKEPKPKEPKFNLEITDDDLKGLGL